MSSVRRLRAVQLLDERLDADADERRQRAGVEPRATSLRRRLRVAVLLGVRAVAVAVLEVDSEVLDRLAAQLLCNSRADLLCEARPGLARVEPENPIERLRIRCVLVQGRHCENAKFRRRVCPEQMRPAIYRMHGLPIPDSPG